MKKSYFLLACAMTAAGARAEQVPADSVKNVALQEVAVVSTRAGVRTPMAYSEVRGKALQQLNTGQDVPFLLSTMPSVTMTSDAGNGIGYTSIRVRGTDGSRINVTANGVPMNDSESSLLYWVNSGDLASSLSSIQLQRGVGTSTNGAGAFGASINMQTEHLEDEPFARLDLSGGSYYTHKETVRFGTGLLADHWVVQGRLSNIGSKGYVDRASAKLNSYFLQGGYMGERTVVKLLTTNGTEETYHAWNYASKWEQKQYGRTYNSCGEYYDAEGNRRYYGDQTDNYHQQNYQLHWAQDLAEAWKLAVALHYTKGHGYYNQYKSRRTLFEYELDPAQTWGKSDLVRQKAMDNDFWGTVFSLNYDDHKRLQATLGGAWNRYDGDHFGVVTWLKAPISGVDFNPDHPYYDNNTRKLDANIYAKATYELLRGLTVYGDLQYRHVGVKMNGTADAFNWDTYQRIVYGLDETYDFLNPKVGLNYQITPSHRAYASYALAHREPARNNYERSLNALEALPTPERLNDFELGYSFRSKTFSASINGYYMNYKDQFVQTGELDINGEVVSANMPKSYRLGVELEAAWKPLEWLRWDANLTLSRNRVKDVNVTLEDGETVGTITGWQPLAFSPDVLFNNIITFTYKGLEARIHTRFVGDQYLTNTGFKTMACTDEDGNATSESLQLKHNWNTDFDLSYAFSMKKWGVKEARVGVTVYNIFSAKYDNNGWASPQYRQQADGSIAAVNTWGPRDAYATGFAPSAPIHCLAHLSLAF